jgi:hypothetical protein
LLGRCSHHKAVVQLGERMTDAHHHRQLDVKPTWGLSWGLFWRMLCLWIFVSGVIFLGYMLVRLALGYTSVFGSW